MITRRGFLQTIGGVAVASAVKWPFRVYSFPSDIVIADTAPVELFTTLRAWDNFNSKSISVRFNGSTRPSREAVQNLRELGYSNLKFGESQLDAAVKRFVI